MRRRQFLIATTGFAFANLAAPASERKTKMIEKTVKTRTIAMNVLEQGEGPLVLLCHGFPETAHAWRHQLADLAAAGYRAIAPDMRGYGKTDRPAREDQYTVFHMVGDMVALLDALGEETAAIVGHDWGATIAWAAAQMRPDRFTSVVALSVPMMGLPPVPPSMIFPQNDQAMFYTLYFQDPALAEAEFDRDPRLTLRRLLFAASGGAGPRKPGDATPNPFGMVSRSTGLLPGLPDPGKLPPWLSEADFDRLVNAFETGGFRGGLNYYRNLDRNWELQQAMSGRRIAVPALFMIGERDTGLAIPGMDQIISAMPALVPNLRGTHVLPGAGHWLQQERPAEVSRLIVDFLAGV